MIGCYDFCGHYEWTFDWLEREGGRTLVRDYWNAAINHDSQRHARDLIKQEGFAGMAKYWGHTLTEESPSLGFAITQKPKVFRVDIHDCPSKGFLLRNGLESYRDYCDHCMGWIGPMMHEAGFVIDHEHNHLGQCWWEMRPADATGGHSAPGDVAGAKDARLLPDWSRPGAVFDRYLKANDPDTKLPLAFHMTSLPALSEQRNAATIPPHFWPRGQGRDSANVMTATPPEPMFRFFAPGGFAITPLLAMVAGTASASNWTQRPAFPLAPGMAGISAGAHGGVVIAAGGANFPETMPGEGGKKMYYDEIFVIAPGETAWHSAGKLPERRAYAATVSLSDGLFVMGGENAETIFQDTLRLRWDGEKVVVERGPSLPSPRTNQAAAVLDGSIYLAGGYAPGPVRVSSGDFLRLDLAHPDAGWKMLASWPGPTRAQAVMAALDGAIYLLSGLEMTTDLEGAPKPVYLSDAYRYRGEEWERLPDMPWSAIGAPSPAPVTTHPARVFVLGGVDGRQVGKMPRDTRVPDHMLCFDVEGHAWKTVEDRWPDPVVTAPTVQVGGEWWIVSGEIMAGVRTTSVWSWKPEMVR